MDPHPAGQPWNKHSQPVQSQPQWQNAASVHLYNPRAVVPPGLNCLVEVEEVILHKKAFINSSEQTLFTIRRESECCGPSFNLKLQDPKKRDVVALFTDSGEGCCGGNSHIVSVNGSCPVAQIIKEGEKKSSKVIFKFPMDMEATLKSVILTTFLYMRYQLNNISSSSSSDDDSGWGAAGGAFFFSDDNGGFSDHGGFNGDCDGGGDWGGGGGDCGGGGGDCGGGGGDCGGGGGDCGGGCD
ncbi:uncharacterized protein ACNLHF_015172 isoform 4-T4 [Anomaloglossus baeobatrachus]